MHNHFILSLVAMQVAPLSAAQKANVEKLSTSDDAAVVDDDSMAVSQRPLTQHLSPQQRAKLIVLEDFTLLQYKLPVPFFKVMHLQISLVSM